MLATALRSIVTFSTIMIRAIAKLTLLISNSRQASALIS
jgi:hypothetical protein